MAPNSASPNASKSYTFNKCKQQSKNGLANPRNHLGLHYSSPLDVVSVECALFKWINYRNM